MVKKMELLRCKLSDLSSKWATLQFPNLRCLDVTEDLTMDKQAIRVIYYVLIVVNTYSEVALDEEFVHCMLYRSDACKVMLRLHTHQSRWRSCRTITANQYFSFTVQYPLFSISVFYCLPVLYFLIHFCVFLVIYVFSVVYLHLFPGLFHPFLYQFRYIP